MEKITVEIATEINSPKEEVFDCLVDFSGYREWMPRNGLFRECRQVSPGKVQRGTAFYDWTIMGKFIGAIITFDRPDEIQFTQKLHWLGIPVMESRPHYTLEATAKGTLLHHTGEARLFGIFGVFKSRARKVAWDERGRIVKALKNKLESSVGE